MNPTPLIKICGLTTPADALSAVQAGTDYLGLNFHPPSPRFISPETAQTIVEILPAHVTPVGLFVNRPPSEILDLSALLNLQTIQLHGDEPPETLAALSSTFQIIRASASATPHPSPTCSPTCKKPKNSAIPPSPS